MTASVVGNMRNASRAFNPFFLSLALGLASPLVVPVHAADSATRTNSASAKKKPMKASDILAVLRVYAETTDDGTAPKAEVIRSRPQVFAINKQPFLDERDIARADVVETADGGFMIQIEGTNHAKQALEMNTITANGRHLIIFGQWSVDGEEKPEERWLAAPLIRTPMHNGSMIFSADCTREEAQRIVDGLNNVAVKLKNQPKSKSGGSTPASQKDSKSKPSSSPNSSAQDLIDKSKK